MIFTTRPVFNLEYPDFDNLVDICPASAIQYDSKYYSVEELIEVIKEDKVFYRDNGKCVICQKDLSGIIDVEEEYEKQFLLPFKPLEEVFEQCRSRGHAERSERGWWRLTPEGMLISNSIISDLLLIQDASVPLAKRR